MTDELKPYTVIITRDATESVVVEVQATDAGEASIKAETYIETTEDPIKWETDDTPNLSKDIYITDVTCDAPEPHTFTFTIGADVRAYGEVEVVADSYEEAHAKLTEAYIQENLLVGDDIDTSGATRCAIIGLEVDGSSEHPHEPAGEDIPYVVDQLTVHPVFSEIAVGDQPKLARISDEDIGLTCARVMSQAASKPPQQGVFIGRNITPSMARDVAIRSLVEAAIVEHLQHQQDFDLLVYDKIMLNLYERPLPA